MVAVPFPAALHCKVLIGRTSRGNAPRSYNSPFAALRCWAHSAMKSSRPTSLQIVGEHHGQVGRPLCKLCWKVWSCLPSPLGAAVLPQSLQDQLPCKNSAHEKVVWLVSSRGAA